jgi:hypothetical protein
LISKSHNPFVQIPQPKKTKTHNPKKPKPATHPTHPKPTTHPTRLKPTTHLQAASLVHWFEASTPQHPETFTRIYIFNCVTLLFRGVLTFGSSLFSTANSKKKWSIQNKLECKSGGFQTVTRLSISNRDSLFRGDFTYGSFLVYTCKSA